MIDVWYFPSWNGDFRLLADPQVTSRSLLEIVNPTIAEEAVLQRFLATARTDKWTDKELALDVERQTIALDVAVAEAGAVLLPLLKPGPQVLTAVHEEGGTVHVTTSAESAAIASRLSLGDQWRAPLVTDGAKPTSSADKPKTSKAKAASVSRPTPSCPNCVPGSIERASEVLQTFLTPRQHAQWAAERSIEVVGHLSGHVYRIAHRHTRTAQRQGRICVDMTDGGAVLHFHDWSVPPEEEVLAAKLVLEHREPWLRNEATCLGWSPTGDFVVDDQRFTEVFNNPFGDYLDGTRGAAMTREIGGFFLGLVGRTKP